MGSFSLKFHEVSLPGDEFGYVPDDVAIVVPKTDAVSEDRLHLLSYIPWANKYLQRIPRSYQNFFSYSLHHLRARTTDVHTATSAEMLGQLISRTRRPIDEPVAYTALLLHDSGWGRLSEPEIADSLDYRGLAHQGVEAEVAKSPKALHDRLGEVVAREVLGSWSGEPRLSLTQKDFVYIIVRNHTEARKYKIRGKVPAELAMVHDADRLWSYSHENFWQDTIRKQVEPQSYAYNLAQAIDGYFLLDEARQMARDLLLDREAEVAELFLQLNRGYSASLRALAAN